MLDPASGFAFASIIGKMIFFFLGYISTTPAVLKNGIPKIYKWDDITYITIPNIIGLTKNEIKKELHGLNIQFVGDGDKVIDVQPEINSRVKMNSTVKILLN